MSDDKKPQELARSPLPFQPENLNQAYQLAEYLGRASLVPDAIRGKPADILMILMAGRDFGLTVTEAFRAVHVIKGRITLSAAFKISKARQSPDCEYFRLIESTNERATYETKRRGDSEPTRLTWTIDQAKRAGLTGKEDSNWGKFPDAMLRSRSGSGLADAVYQDMFFGVPTQEELQAEEVEPGTFVAIPMEAPMASPDADKAKPAGTVVVQGEIVPPDPAEVLKLIEAADSAQTLAKIVEPLQKFPEGDAKKALRKAYTEKAEALKK
jgi:hypothetical protein